MSRIGIKLTRPLRRYLYKSWYRLYLGSAKAHWQEWLPGLELEKSPAGAGGAFSYFGRKPVPLERVSAIRYRMLAREIVIIGSGPSVRNQDFSLLPPRTAILLNGAISLIAEHGVSPLAVMVEDERFVWRHFPLMAQHIADEDLCCFSPSVLRALAELDYGWLIGRRIILVQNLLKPYGQPTISLKSLAADGDVILSPERRSGFSLDPSKGVVPAGSVMGSAFQFAVAANPEQIGFAGIDLSNADQPRFYEERGREAYSGLVKGMERILSVMQIGCQVAESHGTSIENYSPVSALRNIGFGYSDRFEKTDNVATATRSRVCS